MTVIKELLERWDLIALMLAVNIFLGSLSKILRWVSLKTDATWDDEIAKWAASAADFMAKVVDWLQGNAEHKKQDK